MSAKEELKQKMLIATELEQRAEKRMRDFVMQDDSFSEALRKEISVMAIDLIHQPPMRIVLSLAELSRGAAGRRLGCAGRSDRCRGKSLLSRRQSIGGVLKCAG